jgi:tetratricopeptide (TPR) repeat protein
LQKTGWAIRARELLEVEADNYTVSPALQITCLMNAGVACGRAGNHAVALSFFYAAMQVIPTKNEIVLLLNTARALQATGERAKALALYELARESGMPPQSIDQVWTTFEPPKEEVLTNFEPLDFAILDTACRVGEARMLVALGRGVGSALRVLAPSGRLEAVLEACFLDFTLDSPQQLSVENANALYRKYPRDMGVGLCLSAVLGLGGQVDEANHVLEHVVLPLVQAKLARDPFDDHAIAIQVYLRGRNFGE